MLEVTVDISEVLAFEDFQPAWFEARAPELLGEVLAEDARLRLEGDETSPGGKRWASWSVDYAATRTASDKLLYDDGDLAESLDVKMRGGVMQLTSNVPYALAHQYGDRDRNLPARPFAGISRETKISLSDTLSSDMERGFDRVR